MKLSVVPSLRKQVPEPTPFVAPEKVNAEQYKAPCVVVVLSQKAKQSSQESAAASVVNAPFVVSSPQPMTYFLLFWSVTVVPSSAGHAKVGVAVDCAVVTVAISTSTVPLDAVVVAPTLVLK